MAVTLHHPAPERLRPHRPGLSLRLRVVAAVALGTLATVAWHAGRVALDVNGTRDAATAEAATAGGPNALDTGVTVADRAVLGLGDDVDSFLAPAAAATLVEHLAAAVDGVDGRLTQVRVYGDRAFATAQTGGDVVSDFAFHDGAVRRIDAGERPHGDAQFLAFGTADFDWQRIGRMLTDAPQLVGLPGGHVSHVVVDRNTLDRRLPVTVRIHVVGDPVTSGTAVLEVSTAGDLLAVL